MKKLIQYEFRKIFKRRLAWIAVLAVLLLSFALSFSTYQNKFAFDGRNQASGRDAVEMDKAIAAKYEGVLTDEKVQQMLSELVPKSDSRELNAIYLYQNTTQSAVAARFSDINGNWNGQSVSDVFGSEEIRIGYVDGWICASRDMTKIFLLLSFAVIIMIAPVFCTEYGGVDNIILSSRYGRSKCAAAKVIAGFLATVIITAVVVSGNMAQAFLFYGKDGLDCSILFAPLVSISEYIPFNITCGTLLRYQILLAFTGTISTAGITMIFSALCKNQMAALVASVAVYVFPAILPAAESGTLFRLATLSPLYHVLFVPIMSVSQIKDGILFAVFAIPIAVLFAIVGYLASCKIFAGHQVF